MLKGAVYKICISPVTLYGSEAWHLKESKMEILRRTGKSIVRAMCGEQLKDKKRSKVHVLNRG